MLTTIMSVLTLVSAATSGVSYFYARQAVAAQNQVKIIGDRIAERIDGHTKSMEDHTQQMGDHTKQIDDHTQRIDDHTKRVTEWIQQVQSPQQPMGDPYAKGRAEIVERANRPEVKAAVEDLVRRRDQNNPFIPPDPEAQTNQAEWRAKVVHRGKGIEG